MGLTLCSENCQIKTTSRVSEMFRTAVGHTLYDRTINQEIREELNIHNLGKKLFWNLEEYWGKLCEKWTIHPFSS